VQTYSKNPAVTLKSLAQRQWQARPALKNHKYRFQHTKFKSCISLVYFTPDIRYLRVCGLIHLLEEESSGSASRETNVFPKNERYLTGWTKFNFSGRSLLKANSDKEDTSKHTEKFEASERKFHKAKITDNSYCELHFNGIITELMDEFYNSSFCPV
jgi:hypothetical protein